MLHVGWLGRPFLALFWLLTSHRFFLFTLAPAGGPAAFFAWQSSPAKDLYNWYRSS